MKKMFLSIALVIGLISASSNVNAQSGRFSVGAELGLPIGSFSDGSSTGFGGSLRYEHPLSDNMGLSLTAGYMTFSGKDYEFLPGYTITGASLGMIPIQAGLKYYFTEQQMGFYGMLQLGVHMATVEGVDRTEIDPVTGISFTVEGESSSETYLSYAPEIGYHLDNFDFGLRYQMFSQKTTGFDPVTLEETSETATAAYLGLRIAYVFGEK